MKNIFSILFFICSVLCLYLSVPAFALCLLAAIISSSFFQKLFKRTLKKWVTHILPVIFFFLAIFCIFFSLSQKVSIQNTPDIFSEEAQYEENTVYEGNTKEESIQEGFYIVYFDVGQADSTLIVCDGHAMLIDAGLNDQGSLLKNYLKQCGVKQLDYLILTHYDADHIGAADVIIDNYPINTLLMPEVKKDTKTYRDLIDAMKYTMLQPIYPTVGEQYQLGSASFTIIAPNNYSYGDNANNYSVGFIMTYGNTRFFFAGDVEAEAEIDMINNKLSLEADVYKVSHHGSSTCSIPELLDAMKPCYAVISCGKDNSYGHPHKEVLTALESRDVSIFRTDEQGTIYATSDGEHIIFSTNSIAGKEYMGDSSLNSTAVKEFTFPALPQKKVRDVIEETVTEDNYLKISNTLSNWLNNMLEWMGYDPIEPIQLHID